MKNIRIATLTFILSSTFLFQCAGYYQYERKGYINESVRAYSSFVSEFYKYTRDESSSTTRYYPKYYCSFDEPNLLLSISQKKTKNDGDKSIFIDALQKENNRYSLKVEFSLNGNESELIVEEIYAKNKKRDSNIDLYAGTKFKSLEINDYSLDSFTGDLLITYMDLPVQTDIGEANGKELAITADIKSETELKEGDICQIRFISSTFAE